MNHVKNTIIHLNGAENAFIIIFNSHSNAENTCEQTGISVPPIKIMF